MHMHMHVLLVLRVPTISVRFFIFHYEVGGIEIGKLCCERAPSAAKGEQMFFDFLLHGLSFYSCLGRCICLFAGRVWLGFVTTWRKGGKVGCCAAGISVGFFSWGFCYL